uniref:Hypoxia-inducible factor 1 alpha inhibitor n=1 Tax=Rhizophora mucronata TaxID=61149 RepID=A0A2P2MTY2_RHIMU
MKMLFRQFGSNTFILKLAPLMLFMLFFHHTWIVLDLVTPCLKDFPIVYEFITLLSFQHNFRRTLEVLILHLLSPVGAEVLTRKFDEMDQLTSQESRKKFYQVFYSAFDDQLAAMDAILNGKESFALQAFKDVLDKYLGVNSDMLKPSSR